MRQNKTLAVVHTINFREMSDRPGLPSDILREHEARIVGELARMAHLARREFVKWPDFRVEEHRSGFMAPFFELRGAVTASPR